MNKSNPMKPRWPLILCAVFAVLATIASVQLLRPVRFHMEVDRGIGISLLGYTNLSTSCMAAFQLTNRTAATYMCFVGPRATEASRGGRPLFHDLNPAAHPGVLKSNAALTFLVPVTPDTNRWRFSVQLQELRPPRPKWHAKLDLVLGRFGIRVLEPRNHSLTSPSFSHPSNDKLGQS